MHDDIDRDICNSVKNKIIERLTHAMFHDPLIYKKEAFYDPGWRLLFRTQDDVPITINIQYGRKDI